MTAEEQPAPDLSGAPPPPPPPRRRGEPKLQLAVALVGGALVVAVNVVLVQAASAKRDANTAAATSAQASADVATSGSAPALARLDPQLPSLSDGGADLDPSADPSAPPSTDDPKETPSHEPPAKKGKPHTVQWAAEKACTTSEVDGLSRQIIEESRCIEPRAFTRVPARKNLESPGHVFFYMDAPAREHLLKALAANPDKTLKVHSALRTVAQQYLLSRWAAGKRCGIQLATRPGESNHETGLALDVSEPGTWRKALEAEGFKWMGSIDRVHFDYVGPGATHHDGLDVKAFQRLWNRNHADDVIGETGHYDTATEIRLKKSPTSGFPTGARCGGAREQRLASGGSGNPHGK